MLYLKLSGQFTLILVVMDMFDRVRREIVDEDDFFVIEAREEDNIKENVFPECFPEEKSDKDFEVNTNTLILHQSDVANFLSLFESNYENLTKIIKFVFKSPFKTEEVYEIVKNWYLKNEQNRETDLQNIYQLERNPENSNSWLFNMMNSLSSSQRNYIWENYFPNTIDTNAKIDFSEEFNYSSIRKKDYSKQNSSGIRVGDFFTDLKKVCCYIFDQNIFVIKHSTHLEIISNNSLAARFKQIKIGYTISGKNKYQTITAFDILNFGKNYYYITYDQMKFYSYEQNVFSYFHWYPFSRLPRYDIYIIQPFLNHIQQIICNFDDDLFNYIIKWFSFIIQNPTGKTRTSLIILGSQGCGKNTFTNVLCHLLGEYSNPNSDFDSMTNLQQIQNKKLIVCSESVNYYQNRKYE